MCKTHPYLAVLHFRSKGVSKTWMDTVLQVGRTSENLRFCVTPPPSNISHKHTASTLFTRV